MIFFTNFVQPQSPDISETRGRMIIRGNKNQPLKIGRNTMNAWYTAAIASLVLLIEAIVNLLTNWFRKTELHSSIIRAFSGGFTLLLALLSIKFKWFGADLTLPYNPLYAFTVAGFVLMLQSAFSWAGNKITHYTDESFTDGRRVWIGIGIFVLGAILTLVLLK